MVKLKIVQTQSPHSHMFTSIMQNLAHFKNLTHFKRGILTDEHDAVTGLAYHFVHLRS